MFDMTHYDSKNYHKNYPELIGLSKRIIFRLTAGDITIKSDVINLLNNWNKNHIYSLGKAAKRDIEIWLGVESNGVTKAIKFLNGEGYKVTKK